MSCATFNINLATSSNGFQLDGTTPLQIVVERTSFDLEMLSTGPRGTSATVQVGSVTASVPGGPASVTNSGTPLMAVLDFVIPRGIPGTPGDAATIAVASTTTGVPGTSASVTNVGTSSAASLAFVIPRGDTGATGLTGATGPGYYATSSTSISSATSDNPITFTTQAGLAYIVGDYVRLIATANRNNWFEGKITAYSGTSMTLSWSGAGSTTSTPFTSWELTLWGMPGDTGQDGAAATVAVGTTTTGAAGSSASVTNAGTSSAAVLNFTIPRGDTGATGSAGSGYLATSSTSMVAGAGGGAKTFTTQSGLAYIAGCYVRIASASAPSNYMAGYVNSYSGTTLVVNVIEAGSTGATLSDWKISLAGEKGDEGIQGPQGDAGSAATIAVGSTTTGSAGSSAAVSNSGTSSAAVLNFTIPRGDTGVAGSPGSVWYSGSSIPPSGTGVNGDYYFRTDTDDVYLKTAGVWSIVANIKGSTGTGGALANYGTFSDTSTQTIASTTTAYPILFSSTDESNGISRGSPTSRLVVSDGGTYDIQFSVQLENSSTSDTDATIWVRKNGSDLAGTAGIVNIPGRQGSVNGHTIAGWNYVVTLAANDYVELVWSASSTSVTMPTYASGTSPTRPSVASAIVTVTQTMYTQLGNLLDGDKGDITVSGSGASWSIDAGVVTTTKMGGDVTASGKSLLTSTAANTMVAMKFLE